MILKVRSKNEFGVNWEIFDYIHNVRYGEPGIIDCKDFNGYDSVCLNIDRLKLEKDPDVSVTASIISFFRKNNDLLNLVAFNDVAYLCNDSGDTIEKILGYGSARPKENLSEVPSVEYIKKGSTKGITKPSYFIDTPNIVVKNFQGKDVECFQVDIVPYWYNRCEELAKKYSKMAKTNSNAWYDRFIGLLGEFALAASLHKYFKDRDRDFFTKRDDFIGSYLLDVKCNDSEKFFRMLVKYTQNDGKTLRELKSDIYVGSYLTNKNPEAKTVTVILAGFIFKDEMKANSKIVKAYNGGSYKNLHIDFKDLRPMKELCELNKKFE